MTIRLASLLFIIYPSLFSPAGAHAQGTPDDYRRANSLRSLYSGKTKNTNVRPHPIAGTHRFWYSVWDGEREMFKEVDADKHTVTLLPGNPEPPKSQPPHGGKPQRHWMEVPDEKDGVRYSPDGKDSIYHHDNNLWKNGHVLTTDGTPDYYYSAWGSFSPDGHYFATVRIKPAPKHYAYYVESSPKGQIEPILHKQEYAKPGDSLNYRVPVIVDVVTGHVAEPATTLFAHQYEVTMPQWDKNSKTVTFHFNERGHKTYRVLEMDTEAHVRTLIEEKEAKYVNYTRLQRRDLSDGYRILWNSERDGYNHLYLYNRTTNRMKQLTHGEYNVREIQHIDEQHNTIYFSANGMNKDEDPYLIHYYKIRLDGKGLTCLTPEEGHHQATYTDDMAYLIDTYSTVTTPPVSVLRSAKDGRVMMMLEKADISSLTATGWRAPEVFVAPGRDGITPMWGIILRPSNFDPQKRYPVIEYIYSGPGDQYVPKSFREWYWGMAELAELGFIVVQLDAMTTSWRSKAFEEVCYKNLKDAGLPDRIAWIKAAAKKYPYIDADRVGIYGCSAGGQNALAAVLFHGDFYKAAYAACGCHDNRMDKIWWNELWMSYPIDSNYAECSNVENAYRLERPLMLVVGEMDDNVDPASTMQVAAALQKAGKDFELVVIPGARHTMGEAFGEHKRMDFFVRHLLGINPPQWSLLK